MSSKLTDKQKRMLEFLIEFSQENKYPPSVRDIAGGLGLKSVATVKSMLDRLTEKGVIKKHNSKARGIEILYNSDGTPINSNPTRKSGKGKLQGMVEDLAHHFQIPILGKIQAGYPTLSEENIEGYVSESNLGFKTYPNSYFLRVKGNSMLQSGIIDGDLVLIKPAKTLRRGQIGAFRVNNEVTLKVFDYDNDNEKIILHPSNPDFEDIIVNKNDEFEIIGEYILLLRYTENKLKSTLR